MVAWNKKMCGVFITVFAVVGLNIQFYRYFCVEKVSIKRDLPLLSILNRRHRSKGLSLEETDLKKISDIVQTRIHRLQNPVSCSSARKLVCSMSEGCGFGCTMHMAAVCFITAFKADRTFVMLASNWSYHANGWSQVYEPISETCVDTSGTSRAECTLRSCDDSVKTAQVVDMVEGVYDISHVYPVHEIPEDLEPLLRRHHSYPAIWWVGQFMKYMFKPKHELQRRIEEQETVLGFQHPIVGVHIRRSDKLLLEADYHNVDEYMKHVNDFYDKLEKENNTRVKKRRVYLASDDPDVITEARSRYPSHEFLSNPRSAETAKNNRDSLESLFGIIIDIHFLARSDFLVCTLSSDAAKLAFEIMQTLYSTDATALVKSLDQHYYIHGQAYRPLNKRVYLASLDLLGP